MEAGAPAQAFLTPEYLAIAIEHTHSGSLQQYVAAHSVDCQGLEEAVARWASSLYTPLGACITLSCRDGALMVECARRVPAAHA